MDSPSINRDDRPTWSLNRMVEAFSMVDAWTASGEVPAVSLCVGQAGAILEKTAGRFGTEPQAKPLGDDALFLAASLTKPVVAAAVIKLVERGWLTLDERAGSILPAFTGDGKEDVTVRHLLAHTSGLPDQLPQNDALRARHATNETFVAETCTQPLLFPPGTRSSYSSMGYAILGAIVSHLFEKSLAETLTEEIFQPLGMTSTSLGIDASRQNRVARVRLDPETERTQHHWNSPYWLGLGSAWGGLVTTATDYGKFLRMALELGTVDGVRVLGAASTRLMVRNQTALFSGITDSSGLDRPWGLGWRLMWPGSSAYFGDLIGPRGFGHWGATGTVAWADPDRDAFAVILTTLPQELEGAYLARLSNAIVSAFG